MPRRRLCRFRHCRDGCHERSRARRLFRQRLRPHPRAICAMSGATSRLGARRPERARRGPICPAMTTAGCASRCTSCLDGQRRRGFGARARRRARPHLSRAQRQAGRERFLRVLADEFDIDRAAVEPLRAASPRRRAPTSGRRRARAAPGAGAAADQALRQFNALPEGVKFLVDRRAELIELARNDPALRALELDLKRLLAGWFDIGFLEVKRITWEFAGRAPGKADRLRGGARDPQLDRSEEPARGRPPLLCLFPPAHAGRAADLRRGGADPGHGRATSQRCSTRARRSAIRTPPTPRSSIRSRTASAASPASASATS